MVVKENTEDLRITSFKKRPDMLKLRRRSGESQEVFVVDIPGSLRCDLSMTSSDLIFKSRGYNTICEPLFSIKNPSAFNHQHRIPNSYSAAGWPCSANDMSSTAEDEATESEVK